MKTIVHEMTQAEAEEIISQINARLMQGKSLGDRSAQLIRDGWDTIEVDDDDAEAGYQVKLDVDAEVEDDDEEEDEE